MTAGNTPIRIKDPSEISVGIPIVLPPCEGMAAAIHLFDASSVDALTAAYATGRPLLISGEPGIGKSQLARAAAVALDRTLITYVVEPRTEPQDLRYRFDAVGRLADAQAHDQNLKSKFEGCTALDSINYIEPGPLWKALNWESARAQVAGLRGYHQPLPAIEQNRGVVLLIDEIDKADSDIPNSLLDALGNRRFQVPWLEKEISLATDMPEPLIIITTNEERELPVAFIRRCVVLAMGMPEDLEAWLIRCAQEHLACWRAIDPTIPDCSIALLKEMCKLLIDLRAQATKAGQRPPALAEFLDLVKAVLRHKQYDEESASDLLNRMARFTLYKAKPTPFR